MPVLAIAVFFMHSDFRRIREALFTDTVRRPLGFRPHCGDGLGGEPTNRPQRHKTNSGGGEMTMYASRKFNYLFALLIVIALAPLAFSQNASNGEIKGTVFDPSSAVVPGAKVTITNLQTGVSVTTTTNASGIYDVPSVPPGRYSITFSKTGFRELVRQGVNIELGIIAVDATLEVGTATQQVVVTAETQLVQTESSDQQVTF